MNTLLHLCRKDFAFAKPWVFGTWLTTLLGKLLPPLIPASGMDLTPAGIGTWIPAVMIFLTVSKIIHGDRFVGSTCFMGTRPVAPVILFAAKLTFIALLLVMPAVLISLLDGPLMGIRLSVTNSLLLLIETGLFYSLIAAVAVLYASLTRNVGIMALCLLATPLLLVVFMAFYGPRIRESVPSMENFHLRSSAWLVLQAFLVFAAVVIAMTWAAKRRILLTSATLLLSGGILFLLWNKWQWNFVDAMSKDAGMTEIVSGKPTIQWLDEARFVSRSTRDDIAYSQVDRPFELTGLKDGWTGKLVKSKSVAKFGNGTVWHRNAASFPDPGIRFTSAILPQLGIDIPESQLTEMNFSFSPCPWFECEKSRLLELTGRRASISGTGTFQLDQPYIIAELPAESGASVVSGRCRFRIDNLSAYDQQISLNLSLRGIALNTRGDNSGGFLPLNVLIVNPETKEFTVSGGGSGSARVGSDWDSIQRSMRIHQSPDTDLRRKPVDFLKGAKLYLIGTRYGGNISLPYDIPEVLLEEKH